MNFGGRSPLIVVEFGSEVVEKLSACFTSARSTPAAHALRGRKLKWLQADAGLLKSGASHRLHLIV